jgi:AraC family transcriptional regulator, transcriptional activator FtrA
MAQAAGVSRRTLARRFHAALGTTPLQWVLAQRIRRAQELLESTDHPMDQVAERSGLGSPGNLRQQFTRALGMSPQRYRRTVRNSAEDRADARSA